MKKDFYENVFDDATLIKLEIFKRYIREWLPVFMTQPEKFDKINFYDFFAGVGYDAKKNPGSPLIVCQEVRSFCETGSKEKSAIPVQMVFNDIKLAYIDKLKVAIQDVICSRNCCSVRFFNKSFSTLLDDCLSDMKNSRQANLVIMDQVGVKEVTPSIVHKILETGATDILFFISSNYIKRFADTPEFRDKSDIMPTDITEVSYKIVHRVLCKHFSSQLTNKNTMLVPFSIKKGSNVYGVIFATNHHLGMEKFLKVCWSLDKVTGEANYNIDEEVTWGGQVSLFDEYVKPTKLRLFEDELLNFIEKHKPDNRKVWFFGLRRGFCSSKCNDALKVLQNNCSISVTNLENGMCARKGAFYLVNKSAKVSFAKYPSLT